MGSPSGCLRPLSRAFAKAGWRRENSEISMITGLFSRETVRGVAKAGKYVPVGDNFWY